MVSWKILRAGAAFMREYQQAAMETSHGGVEWCGCAAGFA